MGIKLTLYIGICKIIDNNTFELIGVKTKFIPISSQKNLVFPNFSGIQVDKCREKVNINFINIIKKIKDCNKFISMLSYIITYLDTIINSYQNTKSSLENSITNTLIINKLINIKNKIESNISISNKQIFM